VVKICAELFSLCVIPLSVASGFGFQIDEIETEFPNPNGTSEFLHMG
jgi:hypothetical protein